MAEPALSEIESERELRDVYPIMDQLRPVGEDRFVELVGRMREESGYRLFAIEDGEVRGLVGVVLDTNLYHGRHAWVHDLIVDEPYRGEGYGRRMLEWIEEWADERECSCVELASGHWRDDAHAFYEAVGMEKYCFTFKKDLAAESPY